VTSAKAASMALHELATYAVKHGALSNRLAELKSRGLSPTTPSFLTAGDGGPPVDAPRGRVSGPSLIEQ
jgi:hypothetical protein